ncbi:XTP/dITP diphosphatase [candidate division KSB1 bacterium]|nr:XTP/dITP diphosphatase [candidate division KSB1 bacterium]
MKLSLILATNNRHKVDEIKDVLAGLEIDIHTLDEFPEIPEVIEDGDTLEANALKKAREIYASTGILSLADDTGLEVDCIGGQPGVYSSRFSGENATYESNTSKLLTMLKNVPWDKRSAQFRCVMAIVGEEVERTLEGVCRGYILEENRGRAGFGYDPIFYVPEYNQTFAEMPLSLKNLISHRGIALQKVKQFFQNTT